MILAALLLTQAQHPLTGPEIIKKMNATLRAGSPVTGSLTTTGPAGQVASQAFKVMYPRLFVGTFEFMNVHSEIHWTKSGFYSYRPGTNEYYKFPQPPNVGMANMGMYGLDALFGDKMSFSVADKVAKISFNGKAAYAVSITRSEPNDIHVAKGDTLFVDAKTLLPLGFDEDDPSAGGTDHSVYKNLTLHAHLTKKDFDWAPPKGAKLVKQ